MTGPNPEIPEYARGYENWPARVGRTIADSTRAWPKPKRAPEGSPNVVVILVDDLGYSDIGPFGSEILTPNLDRLAGAGLRFTNYHTTPVCSPARAALLTGLNPHRAGYGSVANSDPGVPGLRLELDEDVVTLAEALRGNGYATYGVGKWHLTRDALINAAAPRHTWPIQRGFDRYYGSLEGLNSFFHPNQLIRDNSAVDIEETPDGYYLTDDYTDQALSMIKSLRASDTTRPFFLYFAHTAMHGPLGAKPEDLAAQRGRYAEGWDRIREERFRRQLADGLFPEGTELAPRNWEAGLEVDAWDDLDAETRDLYARYMEVYAAMVTSIDDSLGRLVELLETLGELDNTLIVFTSDNGGTNEGGAEGTRSYFSRFAHIPNLPVDWEPDVNRDPDLIGGPRSMVHYPRGWGMASNTPFRLYKGQTFAGGVRVPLILSWPAGLPRAEGDSGVRQQYQYVTDILPTVLDLAGLEHPGQRHNLPAKEIDGVSFAPVAREDAPSTRPAQYAEFGGNRGYYADGWKIVTQHRPGTPFADAEWQLYHVASDPTELHNLAEAEPERVRELAAAWERAAWENTVFPLGAGMGDVRRPDEARQIASPVTILPGTPRLERYRSAALIQLRAWRVVIDVEVAARDQGILLAHGDQSGGYVVWIADGQLRVAYNAYGDLHELDPIAIGASEHRITLEATPEPDFRTELRVSVDGEVSVRSGLWQLVGMAPFSGISVGRNPGGPVHWDLYAAHGSYPYTGKLRSVRYEPGDPAEYGQHAAAALAYDTAVFYD